jgi:hypothetical protein
MAAVRKLGIRLWVMLLDETDAAVIRIIAAKIKSSMSEKPRALFRTISTRLEAESGYLQRLGFY